MQALSNEKLDKLLVSIRDGVVRAQDGDASAGSAIDAGFGALREELALVLREHAGMADELLRAYEQLGILFEVTRQLPTVHTEEEVVSLFIDSLSVTYDDDGISAVYKELDETLTWTGDRRSAAAPLGAAVTESIDGGRVVVQTFSTPVDDVGAILSAPVFSGHDFACAIALTRKPDARPFEASDMSLLEALVSFCGDLIRNHRLVLELKTMSVSMIHALVSAIDQKDRYTSGHSERVGYYATLLGTELDLSEQDLQMLEWSALLHDVGKIGIRDVVLNKQGKLTDEEYNHIKEHPVRSFQVVRQVPQLQQALDGVHHHHEHFNGSGYPDGLVGEAIPLQARIVQVADVFDALTTSRSYRSAFTWEKALGILSKEAGTVVDPHLVEIFDGLIRREVAENGLAFECCSEESESVVPADARRADKENAGGLPK